jgi:hypothetical protein
MVYPEKLRERALQAVRKGHRKADVAKIFGLGVNTLAERQRAVLCFSGRHFGRTSIVAAKKGKETVAAFAFGGSMGGMLFEGCLEHVFVPALKNRGC